VQAGAFWSEWVTGRRTVLALAGAIGLLAAGFTAPAVAGGGLGRAAPRTSVSAVATPVALPPEPRATAGAHALLVGSYHGMGGQYSDLRAAIDAARPGDWILVGPGDYREANNVSLPGAVGDDRSGAGFAVKTPDIHIRGMDRNAVWLDGTASGPRCSRQKSDQNFGPNDATGNPSGRDGIVVYKVSGVSIENLSACNFLSGDLTLGDQIWLDGGGSSGKQTTMSFRGSYLTATSSYFVDQNSPSAQYGIYSANTAGGPSVFTQDYASNFSDSAFYVGACPQCGVIVDAVHAQDSPEGYSGTNSGGVVIQNSEFDHNRDGFDTNSQNNDDAPSPQTGACPDGGVNPHPPANVQRVHSCWAFENNYVHDNNNPNVPAAGIVYSIPTGDGLTITGGRYDIVTGNRFVNNGAWGIYLLPYPDMETPPSSDVGVACQGGTYIPAPGNETCYYDDYGNEVANNTFTNNGFFGNPTNGDIADVSGGSPNSSSDSNCFHDNVDTSGALTSDPGNIDSHNMCGSTYMSNTLASPAFAQFACAARSFVSCPNGVGGNYPTTTAIPMTLPPAQPTMPKPCAGVPANPWCETSATRARRCVSRRTIVIHVAGPGQLLAVRVTVDGHRVKARITGPNGVRFSLAGRPRGRFTVRVVGRLRSGAVRHTVRRLRTCTPGRG
jgi:Right handed beta helix region